MSINNIPDIGPYTELKPFRFWCQKVLPLVYDESLSYYELLCKVVDYLNKTMEDVDQMAADMGDFRTAYSELIAYVNNYFMNLDVQEEINHKLDQMALDGTLATIVQPFFADAIDAVSPMVSAWLADHVDPETGYVIDDSLTIALAAADAKATGDWLRMIADKTGIPDPADFARGDISSSGNVTVRTYRVITPDTFTVPVDTEIIVDDAYRGFLWLYPVGEDPYNHLINGAVIPANVPCRVVIIKVNEDSSTPANVLEFASALTFRVCKNKEKAINAASWDVAYKKAKNFSYGHKLEEITDLKNQSAKNAEIDYDVRFMDKPFSVRFALNPENTASEVRITVKNAFTLRGCQEITVPVYIEDITEITNVQLIVSGTSFSKQVLAEDLKTGWNYVRFFSEGAGSWNPDTSANLFRFIVNHSASSVQNIWLGDIIVVKPPYANMIIIADGPYYSFYNIAYDGLKAIGAPVSWAVDATLLDTPATSPRHLITEDELETIAADGLSEWSFHSYDLTAMSTATAEEALADTLNSIRYLKLKGIDPNHIWRAAWLQNDCDAPELANTVLEASASYEGKSGVAYYPFRDKYNIPRIALHGKTTDEIDSLFDKLETQHNTVLVYTHGISEASGDMTPAMWTYFLNKLTFAINHDYLKVTTMSRLITELD